MTDKGDVWVCVDGIAERWKSLLHIVDQFKKMFYQTLWLTIYVFNSVYRIVCNNMLSCAGFQLCSRRVGVLIPSHCCWRYFAGRNMVQILKPQLTTNLEIMLKIDSKNVFKLADTTFQWMNLTSNAGTCLIMGSHHSSMQWMNITCYLKLTCSESWLALMPGSTNARIYLSMAREQIWPKKAFLKRRKPMKKLFVNKQGGSNRKSSIKCRMAKKTKPVPERKPGNVGQQSKPLLVRFLEQ